MLRFDADTPATEQLTQGWENELASEFLERDTTHSGSDDGEDELEIEQADSPKQINSLNDAIHWVSQLKQFAIDNGHDSLCDFAAAAEKLEKTLVDQQVNSTQQPITNFFKSIQN